MDQVTLLNDQVETADRNPVSDSIETVPAPQGRSFDGRQIAKLAIAAVATLLVAWLICADLLAHVWYQTRQQSLRGEAASALTRLGSQVPTTGQQVAVLQDPTIGLNVVVAEGTTPSVLRGGPGHLKGTPLPGAKGNSVVYGHRKDWGAPFANLSKVTVGSKLYVQAHPGVYTLPETGDFIFTVTSVTTTAASNVKLLAPSNDYRLTLVTDNSRLTGDRVLVVSAVSGTVGQTVGRPVAHSLDPSVGSLIFNWAVLSTLVLMILVRWMTYFLARRHRVLIVAVVVLPVVVAAAVSLFAVFDIVAFRPLA